MFPKHYNLKLLSGEQLFNFLLRINLKYKICMYLSIIFHLKIVALNIMYILTHNNVRACSIILKRSIKTNKKYVH